MEERVAESSVPRRDLILILSCLALLTGLAWAYLIHLDRQMTAAMKYDLEMAAMGMAMAMDQPWTVPDFLYTFAMWAVMMAGMMVPSAAPVFLLFARMRTARGGSAVSPSVLFFGSGYVAVWTLFSAVATLAQGALHQATLLSPAMKVANPKIAAVILIAAGVYQMTPWKLQCLNHCRSPLGFLMSHWRDGPRGAFLMGISHGAYCLGCCWALMWILFALGIMNLVWVAVVAVFVLVEKVAPGGIIVARVSGSALIIFGIVSLLA
jgi:predicted metal-binding membrane protein